MRAIDLFAGWGGFTEGATAAGIDVVWAANHWPTAVATHTTNHPETTHVCQDLRQADWTALPAFDILMASPACFAAGTIVTTERGMIPIEEVQVGDRVVTHTGRWRPVTAVHQRTSATVQLGVTETTADHRYYSRRQTFTGPSTAPHSRWVLGDPEWVAATEVSGHCLATPRNVDSEAVPAGFDLLPDEFWYEVGHGASNLVFPAGLSSADVPTAGLPTAGLPTAVLPSADIPTAGLPGWVIAMRASSRQALLTGYLDTAGSTTATGWKGTTPSKHLAITVLLLASTLGYATTVCRDSCPADSPPDPDAPRPPRWTIEIRNRTHGPVEGYAGPAGGLAWTRCDARPEPARTAATVFDLTVATDHSFVADGFVVHNCQGHSTASQPRRRAYHDALRSTALAVIDCADTCEPQAIVVENVPAFTRWRLFPWWCAGLEHLGYQLDLRELVASHHGVPQRRKRLFVVATRPGVHVPELSSAPEPGFGPYLEDLPKSAFSKVSSAPPGVQQRIAAGRRRHGHRFLTQHTTNHAGIALAGPIRTITTAPCHWNLVDGQYYRALTGRELARAMGFRDSFTWDQDLTIADVTKGLGNAVCPPVATDLLTAVAGVLT